MNETLKQHNINQLNKNTMKNQKTIIERRYKGVKVSVVLNDRYILKDGTCKVMLKVYHNGKYATISTGHHASSVDNIEPMVSESLQKTVNSFFLKYTEPIDSGTFTLKSLDRDSDSKAPVETVLGLVNARIAKMEQEHRYGTLSHWNGLKKAIVESVGDIPLNGVNAASVKPLYKHLERFSQTTRCIYLNDLKSTLNEAVYRNLMKPEQSPFKRSPYDTNPLKIVIPKSTKRTDRFLTKDEMMKIWDYNMEHPNRHVSVFLLSYIWGGMNYTDLMDLKFDIHWKNTNGTELRFVRKKTESKSDLMVRLPITQRVRTLFNLLCIVEKEGNLFNVPNNPKEYRKHILYMNKMCADTMLRVSRALGIGKKVTPTYARHSFATIANRLMLPYNWIEYQMAHSNNGISSHYMGGFSIEQLSGFCDKML